MSAKEATAGDIASSEWSMAIVARSAPNEAVGDLRDGGNVYRIDPDRQRC
jgi:hypothetical protein